MKRLVTVALMVAGIAAPVCAQRGGARSGFSSHAGSGGRGGFVASAPRGYSGYRGVVPSRAPLAIQGLQRGSGGYAGANTGARAPYTPSYRHRRPYVSPYGSTVFYGVSGYGIPGPYVLDYPDGYDYDTASAPLDNGYQAPEMRQPYPEQPPEAPGVYPQAAGVYPPTAAGPQLTQGLTNEDGVTLVFKDGRAPVQIHDYVLTRSTVYVWDRHQRVIPIDQIDMVATAKANQDAGIDFELPESAK
jgi:hypothetical protein